MIKSTRAIRFMLIHSIVPFLLLASTSLRAQTSDAPFIHPGLLNTQQDYDRMRLMVAHKTHPWIDGWKELDSNRHSSPNWTPHPTSLVVRGAGHANEPQNYASLFQDIAAAYAAGLQWQIKGHKSDADRAVEILNAWSYTLTAIHGTNDKYLASGIYGYEFACAAEAIRYYPGWKPEDFKHFQQMMLQIFLPMNEEFLRHEKGHIDHSWANWDLANIASEMAIGVLVDRRDIYQAGIDYYLHGGGNGALQHMVWKLYDGGLGQWQEAGRDQAHSTLGVGEAGVICQIAWNQGDDLFGADDNRFLKGAEYVAKYNLGNEVPYTAYINSDFPPQDKISPVGLGTGRPIWELLYNHYVVLKGLSAPYITEAAKKGRPEDGGEGPNSGGYDQLGYGTLTFTLEPASKK